MDNTNNIQDNSNQGLTNSVSEQFESPQNLSAQDSCEQENLESTTEDEYTSLLNRISSLENLYSKDNASLFEIIQQYDKLIDQINDLKKIHENLKADSILSNELYDSFKREFANVVENANWGEKLYYALPLFEDYDDKDEWINQWCYVMENSVKEENKENIRIFINRNLYSSVFPLPKDVYYYKANQAQVQNVSARVRDSIYVFSSKTWMFFKFIKDCSESLRLALLKTVSIDTNLDSSLEKIELPSLQKLGEDKNLVLQLRDTGEEISGDINEKYILLPDTLASIIGNPDKFINEARSLYQQVQELQNNLSSLSKRIYTTSLVEVYKLYDTLNKSLSDFRVLEQELPQIDEISKLCCLKFSDMIEKLLCTIVSFLKNAYNIQPLELEINRNFNQYDVNWYDVLVSEDAPSAEMIECISSITDAGFAKYNSDGDIDFVTRPAKISVYGTKVAKTTSEDNPTI